MPIDFPNAPEPDDVFTVGSRSWRYVSGRWQTITTPFAAANVLEIGVVDTLDVNVPATAEITGTSPNQILNLGLPKGGTGNSGINSIFSRQGNLTTTTGTQRFYVERNGILNVVRASVGTPSEGSSIIVDILKNGTTVLGSSISLVAGAFTATGTIANDSVSAGDYFTVDITQIGSVTAGANLTVTLSII